LIHTSIRNCFIKESASSAAYYNMKKPNTSLTLLLLLLLLSGGAALANEPKDSVRILIDVSGSMRWTDPQNLRRPALRLLAELLPVESQAGVWLFANESNRVVPYGPVTSSWKTQAVEASSKIESPGLWTDIARVLLDAREGWETPNALENRNIILLTDGVVDISKDPSENLASKNRLINAIIPQLQFSGIKIHTVALSNEADSDLLRTLSEQTDGAFRMAESAATLQRIFLQLFEKSVKRETVPIQDNRFRIDSSINECTVVVFKSPDSPAIQIVLPNAQTFTRETAPANFRWRAEQGYELITIPDPAVGEWRIIADEDPDNRVMIMTDLKLKTTSLPNNILSGETFDLEMSLLENGALIQKPDFLKLVEFSLNHVPPQPETARNYPLLDHGLGNDKQANDGIYSFFLGKMLRTPGTHQITLSARSRTFERQNIQRIKVFESPLMIITSLNEVEKGDETVLGYTIRMKLILDWVDPKTAKVVAEVIQPDGLSEFVSVAQEGEEWVLNLTSLEYNRKYAVKVQFAATTNTGRRIQAHLPLIDLFQQREVIPSPPPVEVEPPPQDPALPEEEEGVNWLFVAGLVVGANLIMGLLIFVVIVFVRKSQSNIPSLPIDDDLDLDEPTSESSPPDAASQTESEQA
jgi:uncharacterized protein (TIGR03503 family)